MMMVVVMMMGYPTVQLLCSCIASLEHLQCLPGMTIITARNGSVNHVHCCRKNELVRLFTADIILELS